MPPAFRSLARTLVQALTLGRLCWTLPAGGGDRVYLTFDDGPNDVHTPAILDALKAHDAKAAFFVIGRQCAGHADVLRRIVAEGHTLGLHGYTHTHPAKLGLSAFLEEMQHTHQTLRDLLPKMDAVRWVRPPYGYLSPMASLALLLKGYRILMWSRDSNDCRLQTGQAVLDEVLAWRPRGGEILLMHDDYAHTSEVMPQVLAHLDKCGVRAERL